MAKKKVVDTNEGGLPLVKPNKTVMRNIEQTFTDKELIQFGKDLVSLREDVEALKTEKKDSAKEYKMKIDAKEEEMKTLDHNIETGVGEIQVECEVFLNMPNSGRKQICRKDNGDLVEELDMTQDELQVRMEFASKDTEEF